MMANSAADAVLEDALRLSLKERAHVAARLLESLDQATDDNVEEAWGAEIARRIEALDRGEDRPIPWTEARRIILGEADEPTSP